MTACGLDFGTSNSAIGVAGGNALALAPLEHGRTHYTSNLGLPELRSAICRYVNKNFRVAYDPRTEVIITVGVSEAMDLAMRALLDPGDEVLVSASTNIATALAVAHAGAMPVPVDSEDDTWNVDLDAVERKISSRTRGMAKPSTRRTWSSTRARPPRWSASSVRPSSPWTTSAGCSTRCGASGPWSRS